MVRLHRLADRFELIPPEFDPDDQMDANDGRAVLAAWVRWVRRWASDNPGQVFAIQVGGAMLLAGVVFFWLAIAVLL